MTENVPAYVSITFILTTFVTIGFILHAVRRTGNEKLPAHLLSFFVSFWVFFTGMLSLSGFYTVADSVPPRLFFAGVLPSAYHQNSGGSRPALALSGRFDSAGDDIRGS
jgi:hypothetical protein